MKSSPLYNSSPLSPLYNSSHLSPFYSDEEGLVEEKEVENENDSDDGFDSDEELLDKEKFNKIEENTEENTEENIVEQENKTKQKPGFFSLLFGNLFNY